MQWLTLVAAILWVVIQNVASKKKQQARREADDEVKSRQQSAQTSQAKQSMTELSNSMKDGQRVKDAQVETTTPHPVAQPKVEVISSEAAEGKIALEKSSSLQEIGPTQQHILKPSHLSGHAHQETSMEGFERECPPEMLRFDLTEDEEIFCDSSNNDLPVFCWKSDTVANGIVYAEILSKPKALRR